MPGYALSDIEEKTQLLVKRLQYFYKEKQKLEQRLQDKENKMKQQEEQLREYEEKIRIFRMTSPTGEGEDTDARKEIRTTINSYIKEIDHCIAELNK